MQWYLNLQEDKREETGNYDYVHPALVNAPELLPESVPYLRAFNQLVSSRNIGMGSGLIPYSEIIKWLDENKKSGDIREKYITLIQFIDAKNLSLSQEQTENKNNKKRK